MEKMLPFSEVQSVCNIAKYLSVASKKKENGYFVAPLTMFIFLKLGDSHSQSAAHKMT